MRELWYPTPSGGTVFVFPFGAMALYDVPEAEREAHKARLRAARPGLTDANAVEELTVREEAVAHPDTDKIMVSFPEPFAFDSRL